MDKRFNTGSDFNPHGYKTGPAFEGGEHFRAPRFSLPSWAADTLVVIIAILITFGGSWLMGWWPFQR